MDKVTYQMTIDFGLTNSSTTTEITRRPIESNFSSASAVVISLQDILNKRSEQRQATLYRQIASSVSHLT